MAEDTQVAKTPVTQTQETATPTVQDVKSIEQKTPETPVNTESQDGLPVEASERTRARVQEVLKEKDQYLSELKEERQRREQLEKAFASMTQPKQPNQQKPIVDPVTGLIDEAELNSLQKDAKAAREEARAAQEALLTFRKQQEEASAYNAHPWLDPKNKKEFNQEKYNLATGIALASMVNPERFGGKQLDLMGAGEYVSKLTSVQVEKVKEEAAKEAIEQLSPKEQASLEATGSSGRRSEADQSLDYEAMRQLSRKGGEQGQAAIMARLKALKTQGSA
jgi:hypothetical protein